MKNNIVKMNPLTPMQNGMLYHSLLNEEGVNYYQQMCFYLEGEIKVDLLKESWQKVIDRHEIFKTNFVWKGVKTPVQVVLDNKQADLAELDIKDLTPLEQEAYINQFKKDDLQNKFDFQKGNLNRLTLIKLSHEKYFICWTFHHILLDGWSGAIVLGDLFQIYHSLMNYSPLPPLPKAQFSDYLNWLKKQKTDEGLAFWKNHLKDLTEPTLFSTPSKARKNEVISVVATKEIISTAEKTTQIKNFCQDNNITINAFIQTAWGILLQKYNNRTQSCFGMTVAGRPAELKNVEKIVGLFINTIPIFIQTDDQDTLRELLVRVNEQLIQIRRYEYISLAEIQQLNSHLDKMFDSLIVFENYPIESVENQTRFDFNITFDSIFELTTYDLCMEVVFVEEMKIRLAYNKKIFQPEIIKNVLKHLQLIMDETLDNADQPVQSLTLVTGHEKQKLLSEWNHSQMDYPKDQTIHQLFEDQVKRTPEKIAVICNDQQLTYQELNARANQLAGLLRRKGIGPEQIIGIMVERSVEMLIGILGILKAEAACLPIDPEYPKERIEFMLHDSKPAIVMTKGRLREDLRFTGEWVDLNEKDWIMADYNGDILTSEVKPQKEQLLYIIYTSGSTGKPKGVMLNHHNLINLIYFEYNRTNIDFQSKVLQFNTISFDVSFQEIFSTLLAGGQLYLISQEQKENLPELFCLIKEKQIEILFLPVAFLKFVFAEKEWIEMFPRSVKHIVTAGEQLIIGNGLRNYLKANHVFLHNHYGPSETHVATTLTLNPDEMIPELPSIGKPITNTSIYILDHQLNLQPIGVVGELYIGGDAVGGGYLNRPELTEQRFLGKPFTIFHDEEPGQERIYKTGDMARWLPNGNLEFLGRTDQQVKIRGFRIEPGEIETQLLNHTEIKEAVVADRSDEQGDKYLTAYFVSEQNFTVQSLKEYLARELPDYMIPTYFVQLDRLPLTPSGKINRQALPAPQENIQMGIEYLSPSDEREIGLAKIWAEILGVQKIGSQDDFFAMGGHSLKATQLVSRIFKELKVEISLREVFKNSTLKEMAELIKGREEVDYGLIQVIGENNSYPTGCYPTSSAQKRIFLLEKLEEKSITYNIPTLVLIEGQLDEARLEVVFQELVNRHESFRTSFVEMNGEVVQKIHQDVIIDLEKFELDGLVCTENEKELEIEKIVRKFIKPFHLNRAPLLRVGFIRLAESKTLLLLDLHHIISDGGSINILFNELASLYAGEKLPELRIQYKDFAVWQNNLLKTDQIAKQEEFWLNSFANDIPVLNLPTDYSRPSEMTFEGKSFLFSIDEETSAKVNELATQTGVTLYMTLLAILNLFLSKYSDQEDIIIGSPIAGRRHTDLENIIGMFVNTLALRNKPEAKKTFERFLVEVKENALQAYENQDYQYEILIDKLQLHRDLSRNALFDVMFALQNNTELNLQLKNITFRSFQHELNIAKFDLTLYAVEQEGRIQFNFEYSTKLFKLETIKRFSRHFIQLIKRVVENPKLTLRELELISPEEKGQILREFNNTRMDYPKNKTIANLFEEEVRKVPNHNAVLFMNQEITYSELNKKANQLARFLRNKGVGSNQIIGLMVDRSVEMLIGILGILKAGGAYLPIDPENPEARVRFMLEDCDIEILLTQRHVCRQTNWVAEQFYLEDEKLYIDDTSNLQSLNSANDLAYVIYTSGSTGKPKGCLTMHFNIIRAIKNSNYVEITEGDRILQLSNYAFDGSTFDIYGALLNGATLVMLDKEVLLDVNQLASVIQTQKITAFFVTTALFNLIVELKIDCLANVRKVLFGGERASVSHVRKALTYLGEDRLINVYGPTESTVFTSYYPVNQIAKNAENIPIGIPLANTCVYILNKHAQLQPIGIPGELFITGDGLAKGYLKRPDLTEERFIDDPFIPENRIYKTGDLARWLPDGNIEFLGRIDQQVKIRGYRIELGEIETHLLDHPQIKEVFIIERMDSNDSQYLCAFIVSDCELEVSEIKSYLSRKLPEYMIPASYVFLNEIPLTSNGKVDRRALLRMDDSFSTGFYLEREFMPPETEAEEKMAKIWSEILGIDRVGVRDHFFELGGHSLKATQLIAQIYKEWNVKIPLKQIFKTPSIKELVKLLDRMNKEKYTLISSVISSDFELPENHYPVSSAQKRLFTLKELEGNSVTYNMPMLMILEGNLDPERFETVLNDLVERYESFRTSFTVIDDKVVQRIHPDVKLKVWQTKVSGEDFADRVKEIVKEFIRPFDLEHAPLVRVGLVQMEEDKHLFMLDMHHIISDGKSMDIFFKDFSNLYAGRQLPELKIQYKDFAVWQNNLFQTEEFKKQEEYWLNLYADEVPLLNLPTDFSRPVEKSFEGSNVSSALSEELSVKVNEFAIQNGSTLYMVLFATFNILLTRYTGQEDIVVGSPIAGRQHTDLDHVIGMFVNTLAMRNYPDLKKTFKQFLLEVRENALKAYENQDYQFEMLVERLNVQRDLSRNALIDVMFVLQNANESTIQIDNLSITPFSYSYDIAKFDLAMNIFEDDQRIYFNLEYCSKLFMQSTIERMARHYINLIHLVIENLGLTLAEIDMVTAEEKEQLLIEFNDTMVEFPKEKTIQQLFVEQVDRTPNYLALTLGDQELTYRELDLKSTQLAHKLRSKGIGSNQIVGIMVERSLEMVIGIIGILKVGSAYLPIDPEYPKERIELMVKDCQVQFLLNPGGECTELSVNGIEQINVDINSKLYEGTDFYENSLSDLSSMGKSTDLAYVIYTSGSTGQPKGVMIEHRNILNTIIWRKREYQLISEDRILQMLSFAFDGSVAGFFASLISGAQVVLLRDEDANDPIKIKEIIREKAITQILCVPSLFQIILEFLTSEDVRSLKTVTLGGEGIQPNLVKKVKDLNDQIELVNEYGPTENSVTTTMKRNLQLADQITIGKPIANTLVYLIDQYKNLVPIGVVGELCISGEGLARGYINRKELTEEKFILNPFQNGLFKSGTRMYRTGDLARWLPNGDIEFLGRIDNQVKIRGYRIESGEIEKQLLELELVKEAFVMKRKDNDGGSYLCAYIVKNDVAVEMDFRKELAKNLPEYMVPSQFVFLEKMPLNANGKIDRQALSELNSDPCTIREYVAPETEMEKQIEVLWSEILGIEKVGIDDNFFELGGHSLKAISLLSKIRTVLKVELPLRQLMKKPTIRELAEYIDQTKMIEATLHDDHFVLLRSGQEITRHLFLVHGGDGEVGGYLEFCENLMVDINCWGVRAEQLKNSAPSNLTIERIANRYISKIKTIQPEGPYSLAGWCIGGTIIFEMINQLEQMGDKIAFASLIDSPSPNTLLTKEARKITYESELDWLQQIIPSKEILEEISIATEIEQIWSTLIPLLKKDEQDVEQYKHLIPGYFADIIPNFDELGIADVLYYLNVLKTLDNARAFYIPNGQIDTQIHFFKAAQSEIMEDIWNAYCNKPIKKYGLIGDHYSIFKAPQVIDFAKMFSVVFRDQCVTDSIGNRGMKND